MAEFDINQILQRYGRNPERLFRRPLNVNNVFDINPYYKNYLPTNQQLLTTSGKPLPNVNVNPNVIADELPVEVYRVGEDGRFYGSVNKAKDAVTPLKTNVANSTKIGSQIAKNANESLNAAKTMGGNVLKYAKAGGGFIGGKVVPALTTAGFVMNAIDDNAIADKMQQINILQPGTYSPEQIAYYRNRARATEIGMGAGTTVGGIAGAGAFSVPGALIGSSTGPMVTRAGYWLGNLANNNINKKLTREELETQLQLLEKKINDNKNNEVGTNNINKQKSPTRQTVNRQVQPDRLQQAFSAVEQSLPYEDNDVIVE